MNVDLEFARMKAELGVADDERKANGGGDRLGPILSSGAFVAGFQPPDYLIKRMVQRRFFYSLTARTGDGKTPLAMLLTACTALDQPFAGRAVNGGAVLYFAGENPTDVQMRWIAMPERLSFDVAAIPVHFVPGVLSIPDIMRQVRDLAEDVGGLALVIIDTTAAYFDGEDDNSNVQAGSHARSLRALTGVPGGPCVIACSHPT
jgi:RecA-family ATPase